MSAKVNPPLPQALLVVFAGLLALVVGLWAGSGLFGPQRLDSDGLHGTYLPGGRAITDFELITHTGEPFTGEQLRGHWTLLFFGFTNCPDICPMTMLELGQAVDQVRQNGVDQALRGVFVTVDPARDTPQRLRDYVTAFHPEFIGVTGALENIDVLARDLGIVHVRHGEPGDDDYMVDHGSAVLLINPDGRLQALFQAPHRSRELADDLTAIIAHHQGR